MNARHRFLKPIAIGVALGVLLAAVAATGASAKSFRTEDGNIACLMRSKFVRCDISKHRWKSPPKPKSCEFDWGSSVGLNDRGRARFLCVSDATPDRLTLAPGDSLRVGPFTCRVRKGDKVLCLYGNSGGFVLGPKRYELF